MTKKEHNGRMMMKKPKRRSPSSQSRWDALVQYDRQLSLRCSVCASADAPWGSFRPLMKLLEISGHGLPWFSVSLYVLYRAQAARDSELFNPTANLILGLLLDLLISFILKGSVQRPRPANNKSDMLMTLSVDGFSFPSGHCTRAAFVLYFFATSFELSLAWQALLLVWTFAVCVSRVVLGRHYWSDVISGAVIGLIQGVVIQRHWKTWDLSENAQL